MNKYILVAALAAAPMLASTSAHAITVPQGSSLEITITGSYGTQDGGNLGIGSVLNLNNVFVSSIIADADVDLKGLGEFTFVPVSGQFTLADEANSGLAFTFLSAEGASFTISQTGGTFVVAAGPDNGTGSSGQVGLGALANGNTDSGSFSFGTTSDSPTGTFLTTFAVPPEETIEELFSPIPLPAAAWMLLASLGSLLAFRRYAKT